MMCHVVGRQTEHNSIFIIMSFLSTVFKYALIGSAMSSNGSENSPVVLNPYKSTYMKWLDALREYENDPTLPFPYRPVYDWMTEKEKLDQSRADREMKEKIDAQITKDRQLQEKIMEEVRKKLEAKHLFLTG